MSSPTSHLWSSSQKLSYCQLLEIAELYLYGDLTNFPVRPRLAPLLVSPSGQGKTFVIKALAAELGLPYLRLTSASWIVAGARENPTMLRVQEFVDKNDQGIIHLDELDKFSNANSWGMSALLDVYDLLDRSPSQPAKNMEWTEEVLGKLKDDFLIIASATFQSLWTQAMKPKVGFGEIQSTETLLENVRRLIATSDVVEAELLRRLNEPILMAPATESDFRDAARDNGLSQLALALHETLNFEEAAQSNLGARWMEEAFGRLLLKARRENRLDLVPLRPFEHEIRMTVQHDDEEEGRDPNDDSKYGLDNSVL